jgi:hypothetical protein
VRADVSTALPADVLGHPRDPRDDREHVLGRHVGPHRTGLLRACHEPRRRCLHPRAGRVQRRVLLVEPQQDRSGQTPVGAAVGPEQVQPPDDGPGGDRRGEPGLRLVGELPQAAFEQRGQQVVPRREVPVERADRHACPPGHLLEGGVRPALGEQGVRRFEQPRPVAAGVGTLRST